MPAGDLREALIAALKAQHLEAMAQLIDAHVEAIRESFPQWTTVPQAIRSDPEAMQHYAHMLYAVASVFQRSGDDSLMARISANNPMEEWNRNLASAKTLIDAHRAAEAVPLLKSILSELQTVSGTAVQHYRPRALGALGIALAQIGDKREAVRVTKEALLLCQSAGDEEGIRTYTHNLDTFGTYELPANDGTDANMTVVCKDERGRTLELDELRTTVDGTVQWEVRGGGAGVTPETRRLHEEARAAGARGDYDTALVLLTRVAVLVPAWPYPVYDRAFTHLLLQNYDAALEDYRRTVELAPGGFFTAEVALDMLSRESTGEFPSGLYHAFAMLEHLPAEQRCAIVRQIVEKFPSHAPAWNEFHECVTDPAERLEAVEKGLAARPDAHTRGFLMVKKAFAMSALGDNDGALSLLQPLATDSASLSTRVLVDFALIRLSSR